MKYQCRYPKSLTFLRKIIPEVLFDNIGFYDILRINDREGNKVVKDKINSPPLLFSKDH